VPVRPNTATGDDPAEGDALEAVDASRPAVLAFIHKGRDDAPDPYVPAPADQDTAALEFDPEIFRDAVRVLRPAASIAEQLRSAYKEAST